MTNNVQLYDLFFVECKWWRQGSNFMTLSMILILNHHLFSKTLGMNFFILFIFWHSEMWQYAVQFHARFIGPSTLRMGPADLLKLGRYWTSTWKEFGEKWRSLSRKISLGTLAFPISVLRSSISYWALPKQLPLCVRWWHYTNIYIYRTWLVYILQKRNLAWQKMFWGSDGDASWLEKW